MGTRGGDWSLPAALLLADLRTSHRGLSWREAEDRLSEHGLNRVGGAEGATVLRLAANQFRSPLVLILAVAALISIAVGEWADAAIVPADPAELHARLLAGVQRGSGLGTSGREAQAADLGDTGRRETGNRHRPAGAR